MSHERILIFIPTFNESGNVERMARELSALNLNADILFLDDNSPDGTGSILARLAENIPRMSVIYRTGKQGIGSAHQVGIAYAYDGKYDILVTLDCDFTHDPNDIPRMLAALSGHDVVVGSRYIKRGSLPGWNLPRRCLTILGHCLTTALLNLPQDASGAFRVYDLNRISRRVLGLATSKSYSFFFESLFVMARNELIINEIPIVLPARTYGSSKLTVREALRGGKYLMQLSLGNIAHPERFRLGRTVDSTLDDKPVATWDCYWSKKESTGALIYDLIAAFYRKFFIRPNLSRALKRYFKKGHKLLHAGCGSGQADVGLHEYFQVTAVDISLAALQLYVRNNPKVARIEQADIFSLPFGPDSFDGIFNLGVMEHFEEPNIQLILKEFKRVLKPGGKLVLFWPHAHGSSVYVLKGVHFIINKVVGKMTRLHPDEITLMTNRANADKLLAQAGLRLIDYRFDWRDMFVHAVVTGR